MVPRKVVYSYLDRQFKDAQPFLKAIEAVVLKGDFTLGEALTFLEQKIASICKTAYAVGVNSGTDALFLILKALDIGAGDEVITPPNSFIATTGAIVQSGAAPIFVDVAEDYNINPDLIEKKITSRTKAIMPVHLTGNPADMGRVLDIANRHGLFVIEDAAQAIGACFQDKPIGSFGIAAGFSFHPLKNINGWGDGGVITTNSGKVCETIRFLRNHGLKNRDECVRFGYNSRLDSIQAAIILQLIDDLEDVSNQRIKLARRYDSELSKLKDLIIIPPRRADVRQVFHTYVIQAKNRNALKKYLEEHGIEAKIHYPIPIHLQEASKNYGYKKGDFPSCEQQAENILTLPFHQHLKEEEVRYVCDHIKQFYC